MVTRTGPGPSPVVLFTLTQGQGLCPDGDPSVHPSLGVTSWVSRPLRSVIRSRPGRVTVTTWSAGGGTVELVDGTTR